MMVRTSVVTTLLGLALAGAAGGTALAAEGSPVSGKAMLEACRALGNQSQSLDALSQGTCAGIVTAVTQTSGMMVVDGKPYICMPAETPYGQVMSTVVSYMDAHPDQLSKNLSTLTAIALHEAFPCKN
jgi:hypothetical protein